VRWSESRATPCLRCLAPEPPAPGEVETCESAGVLAAAAGIAASLEAALAIRLLAGTPDEVPANLVRFDLARFEFHHASILGARDPSCPCCANRRFDFLDGHPGDGAAGRPVPARVLCGRGAVEVRLGRALDAHALDRLAARLAELGTMVRDRHDGTEVLRVAIGRTEGRGDARSSAASTDGRTAGAPTEGPVSVAASSASLVVLAGARETLAIVEGTTDSEFARGVVARFLGV
jgi:hypothetical protein